MILNKNDIFLKFIQANNNINKLELPLVVVVCRTRRLRREAFPGQRERRVGELREQREEGEWQEGEGERVSAFWPTFVYQYSYCGLGCG